MENEEEEDKKEQEEKTGREAECDEAQGHKQDPSRVAEADGRGEQDDDDEDADVARAVGGGELVRPTVDGRFLRFLHRCLQVHSSPADADWDELKESGAALSLDDCFAQLRLLSSEGLLDGLVSYAAHQNLLDSCAAVSPNKALPERSSRKANRSSATASNGEPSRRLRPTTAHALPIHAPAASTVSRQDIVLNVVDDAKQATKQYKIPVSSLLRHMGYFSNLSSSLYLDNVVVAEN
ncbi:unnamed protein product [Notodromas monacha]|uniref:Uncharacterized protein n=1 Tax=Notodromas monacha TaxID=399045 RepID=A0A7R9GA67_9CRUS|nr:unnamed protein product [Notodromas monacha]CAG0913684.1 unnamed protein product [Notodromas monacha]